MKEINTVIFDLDGTLLDTLEDLSDSVNFALESHALPQREKSEIRLFLGNGIRNLVEKSVPQGTPECVFEEVFKTFKSYYMLHCLDKTKPYEGIAELLCDLKRKGYKMAIVSNKVHSAVQELRNRFFADTIDVAIGESAGIRRKPSPDSVLEAIKLLGSNKKSTIYVGDSEVDFQTAQNACLPCISVLRGFRDKEFLEHCGANIYADSPKDILDWLEQKNYQPT